MPHARRAEDGFVLITAVWLLLLCAAIVAMLMLRGNAANIAADDEGKVLKERLALDAATETVIADLLLKGPTSRWGNTPTNGMVMIGNVPVTVTVTNEAGRLDLNEGDLPTIDLVLRHLGFNAAERTRFIDLLRARRQSKQRAASTVEAHALLAGLGSPADGPCLGDLFTVFSAMEKPRPGQMPGRLATALGDTPRQQPLEPGTAVRIDGRTGFGKGTRTVVRVTGLLESPYAVFARGSGSMCSR